MTKLRQKNTICPGHSASKRWSPGVGQAAPVSVEFGKGSGHKDRGLLSRCLQLCLRDAMFRSIPGSGHWAGTRPLLAPKVARRTPRLHPGAGRASSASSPRARGTRAAGGTWGLSCNASSSKSLSTAGMVPRGEPRAGWKHGQRMARQSRVLQAQATSVCSVPWVAPRNFMAAVTISSDFGAPQNKVCRCFHCFLIICHEVMGPDAMIFVF